METNEEQIKEAKEALKTLKIYVKKHDHIGSIEKAFCRVAHIDWDSLPDKLRQEYESLSDAADEKIEDLKWMESNGH